jgi:hypothetical protein
VNREQRARLLRRVTKAAHLLSWITVTGVSAWFTYGLYELTRAAYHGKTILALAWTISDIFYARLIFHAYDDLRATRRRRRQHTPPTQERL